MKNEYQINGPVTTVYLPRRDGTRLEMLIDTVDLPRVMKLETITWYGTYKKSTKSFYAQAHIPGTKQGKMYFHRWIMNARDGMDIDHRNHNTLDNRRSVNIREVTRSENNLNTKRYERFKRTFEKRESGVKYVCWDWRKGKWIAKIKVSGKNHYLGRYDDVAVASRAVDEARKNLHLRGVKI